MSLLLGEYVNNNFISMGEFINGFSVFVSSLSGTREDLYHFYVICWHSTDVCMMMKR